MPGVGPKPAPVMVIISPEATVPPLVAFGDTPVMTIAEILLACDVIGCLG